MQYYGAFYKSALYPLLERINAYLMRWMREEVSNGCGGRKKAPGGDGTRPSARRPRFFAHWAWVTEPPESGDQDDKSRMTGDCHVRICGGRGVKFPPATRLREGDDEVGMLCRFIDAEKAAEDNPGGYSVSLLCRVAGGEPLHLLRLAGGPAGGRRAGSARRTSSPRRSGRSTAPRAAPTAPRACTPRCGARAVRSTGRRSSGSCGSATSAASPAASAAT